MGQQILHARSSWLSLVAETAGVSGATVARVEICGDVGSASPSYAPTRAVVQILDDAGHVIGAAAWEGEAAELSGGVRVDVGCDLGTAWASRVVGWIETSPRPTRPEHARAPWDATSRSFEPGRAMKLMLGQPRPSFVARRIAPMEAA